MGHCSPFLITHFISPSFDNIQIKLKILQINNADSANKLQNNKFRKKDSAVKLDVTNNALKAVGVGFYSSKH